MAGLTLYCQGCNKRLENHVSSAAISACPFCGSSRFSSQPKPISIGVPPHQMFNLKGLY